MVASTFFCRQKKKKKVHYEKKEEQVKAVPEVPLEGSWFS